MEEERIRSGGEKTRLMIMQNNLVLEQIRDFAYITMLFICGGIVHYFHNNWIYTTATVVVVIGLEAFSTHTRKDRFIRLLDRPDDLF